MSKRKAKSSLYKKTLDYYVSLKAIYFGLVGGGQREKRVGEK